MQAQIDGAVHVGQDFARFREDVDESTRIAGDLSQLTETANAPLFGVEAGVKVTEWNTKAFEISVYSKSETVGRQFEEEFIPEAFKEKVQEAVNQALDDEEEPTIPSLGCRPGTGAASPSC